MIKQFLLAVGIFIVVVIGGFIFSQLMNGDKQTAAEVKIGEAIFQAEIADTPALRAKGLSGRDYLKPEAGMLFVFPAPAIQKFWMKDMKIPLDIIWINDNRVIGMVLGAEPEGGPDYTIFTSPEPVDGVLEINSGLVQRLGIKVGDSVMVEYGPLNKY